MALDGLVVRALKDEMQALRGGRIHKIYQPSDDTILMQVRLSGRNLRLLFSAHPVYPRVHLTERAYQNPLEAPMFCMLLRKHLEGGIIEDVRQPGMERVLEFAVRQRDELGDLRLKRWIAEIMGRHSNLILCGEDGVILDGIRHVTPSISSHRIVMPGHAYAAPPEQGKANPLDEPRERFLVRVAEAREGADDGADPARTLVELYSGVSPLAAKEIACRAGLSGAGTGAFVAGERASGASMEAQALWPAFEAVMRDIAAGHYQPQIGRDAKARPVFSVIELTHLNGERRRYSTVSECLEAFYGEKAERDAVKTKAANITKVLQNEIAKNRKKLEKLQESAEEARDAERIRVLGELLTVSLHQIVRGDERIEVINYYDEEAKPVEISLDPALSPSENAQRYFRKYTKLKNSLVHVAEQQETAEREIAYLDAVLSQMDSASLADLEEIQEELTEQGYLRSRRGRSSKKKKDGKPRLVCYTSSEGLPIYVGKNNLQNEYLTNRLADGGDTWLHTKDIPGSHVVIRSRSFGDATLEEAAKIAAYYSKAKESSLVPVDYTLIKHVRKPSGAKPGFVIYDHQKTVFVTPDPEWLKGLPERIV